MVKWNNFNRFEAINIKFMSQIMKWDKNATIKWHFTSQCSVCGSIHHPCTLRHRKHIWSRCCVSFSFMSPQFPKIWLTKGNSLPHKFSHTQLNPLGLLVVYNNNGDQMQLSWNNLRASHAMQSTVQSYVYYISNSSATGSRVVVMIYRKLFSIFLFHFYTFVLWAGSQ